MSNTTPTYKSNNIATKEKVTANTINKFIDSLPSCGSNAKFVEINCPELTQDELNNFCFHDINCRLVCPKNKNLTKNLIPKENDSSIMYENFSNIQNMKKYYDPSVYRYKGFINRVNSNLTNLSNVSYKTVQNSLIEKYNSIILNSPLKKVSENLIIEKLESSKSESSSDDSSPIPSILSCCCFTFFFVGIGIAIYFIFIKKTDETSSSVPSTDSSAPSL
jgi:2-phospho-L-lactate guanylyltransferase (CobY/MobA/RfbA family)